ncbi:hypothetical protein MF672_042195 [Actinomadura sp. ATCC 31491]|uniref:Uncharacterized protein n=1 Tax=Actinomadura luzonensis TaxID=2805427 RepID=A0ABT0G6Z5_9ACTN|nr:DUF6624 domain-containing protein [Actinomadura luzonensis]MCK2220370.1 hypothetical protein [Actinomadura luzonensis]
MFDAELRDELLARLQRDQQLRLNIPRGRPVPADVLAEWTRVDTENSAFLKRVVAEHGWPGRDLVGEDGAHAAWLLAQHAGHDLEFQRRCLSLLREAVERGQATAREYAYLLDRVRVREDRPQVYGTQYRHFPDGGFGPHPVEDPERLDERRAEAGLEPHAEYDRLMRKHQPD